MKTFAPRSLRALAQPLAAAALLAAASTSFAQVPRGLVAHGQFLGQDAPSHTVAGAVALNLHNKAELDARVQAMYTPGSPTYRQWLSPKDLAAYTPTAADIAAVKQELAAHGLKVTSVGPLNLSVRFTGSSSAVESAFHTELSVYKLRGQQLRAFSSKPTLAGGATGLLRAVTGISGASPQSHIKFAANPATGKVAAPRLLSGMRAQGAKPALTFSQDYTPTECFSGPSDFTVSNYPTPTATYSGLSLASTCFYSPQDLWAFYGLTYVYAMGYTGAGQTIVLIDPYGSPTLASDYATFNDFYGLSGGQLNILTPSPVTGANTGWAEETTLDVEAAHAIAPDATVDVVVTPTNSYADLMSGLEYAIANHLGDVISNSYGSPESETDPLTAEAFDQENELAASEGISVQYSTGDDGDYSQAIGYTDVSVPADSPYGTAVGGTTIAIRPDNSGIYTTGWGNNAVALQSAGIVEDPPQQYGFQGGAGGGQSNFFPKPSYQSSLSGTGRQLPDISALADPFTGFGFVFTFSGGTAVTNVGGTSLASPLFSAMWALANQYEQSPNGLGAASFSIPTLAMYTQNIDDIGAPPDGYGLTGVITDANGTTNYSSDDLSQPLQAANTPVNVLLSLSGSNLYSLSFATDTSLTVGWGWDPVTGWGTPDFNYIAGYATPSKR